MVNRLPKAKDIRAVAGWFYGNEHYTASHGDFGGVKPEAASFQIGSVTKLFTATLAAILQQNGTLALKHRVSKYLELDSQSTIGHIVVEDLLTHHSGLPSLPKALFKPKYDPGNPFQHITKDALYTYLNNHTKRLKSGKRFEYSHSQTLFVAAHD